MQIRHIATLLTLALAASLTRAASAQEKPQLPFTISKETTAIVSPLKPNGAINYIQALNEKYGKGVTPDNNGFIPWLEIVERKSYLSPEERAQAFKLLGVKDNFKTKEPVPRFLHFHDYLAEIEKLDFKAPPEKDMEDKSQQFPQRNSLRGWPSEPEGLNAAQMIENDLDKACKKPWNPKDYPHVAAYLAHEEKKLDLAHIAVAFPRWWSPYAGETLLPFFGRRIDTSVEERYMIRAWCARAMMRANAGDFDGFLADIVAARQLARHIAEAPEDLERYEAVDFDTKACKAAAAFAATGALTADQSRQLTKAMAQFPALPPTYEPADTLYRWKSLEVVQMIALSEKPDLWDNMLVPLQNISGKDADWNIVLKRVNAWFDVQLATFKKPTYMEFLKASDAAYEPWDGWVTALNEKGFAKAENESREAFSNRVADGIITRSEHPLDSSIRLDPRLVLLQQQMLQTILDAAEYHALHKKWPASLEDLPPEALKKVPLDPYWKDGADPVRYAVTEKGIRLYSVGRNGRLDDNGEPLHPITLGIEKESPPPTH